jgi:hypothetical protein
LKLDDYLEQLVGRLKAMVSREVGALSERLDVLVRELKALPAPQKGDKGDRGDDGKGEKGEPGRDGKDGADGKSITAEDVTPLLETQFAKWAIEVERRAMDLFQRTAAAMPVPKDGLSFEDLQVEHDGDGTITLRLARGELKKEFMIRLPRFKDKGVYREGEAYREGDGVTWGGSLWLAQRDAPEGKPDGGNGHWRLAVKRGRDGKDAK